MSDVFDEIFKSFRKLTGGGSQNGKKAPSHFGVLKILLIVIAIVVLGNQTFYSIDEKEVGVITRLGRYYSKSLPGLHFKVPFIDRLYRVPQTTKSLSFGYRTTNPGVMSQFSSDDYSAESTILTGDLNIIDQSFAIQYFISNPRDWLFNVDKSPAYSSRRRLLDNRVKTIRDVCISVVNRYVGNTSAESVQESGRTVIAEPARLEINEILQERLKLGVTLNNLNLNQVIYNEIVQKAIEDVNAAEQDRDRFVNEGQESYNKEIPKVRGEALQKVLEAEGAVARFNALYQEYKKNPAVFRQRYYYETMEKVISSKGGDFSIVDKKLENFLPLKNLSPVLK